MFDVLPLMCAAGLSMFYSGQITSTDQLQIGHLRSFSREVPNNGFILQTEPELWGMSIKMDNDSALSGGGLIWFQQSGPLRWSKGQAITVHISACEDGGVLAALKNWNAFAPTIR